MLAEHGRRGRTTEAPVQVKTTAPRSLPPRWTSASADSLSDGSPAISPPTQGSRAAAEVESTQHAIRARARNDSPQQPPVSLPCRRGSMDNLTSAADAGLRRNTAPATQPHPPPRVPNRAALSPSTPALSSEAGCHAVSVSSPLCAAATAAPAPHWRSHQQRPSASPPTRTPEERDHRNSGRSRCQSIDQQALQRHGSVPCSSESEARPDAVFTGVRLVPGAASARRRHSSLTPLAADGFLGLPSLVAHSTAVAGVSSPGTAANGSTSTSARGRLHLTPPTLSVGGPDGAGGSRTSPRASMQQAARSTSPLSSAGGAPPTVSPPGSSRRRSGRSRRESSASTSLGSSVSLEDHERRRRNRGEGSANTSWAETAANGSPRSASSRRVHFTFGEPGAAGAGAADTSALSMHSGDDVRAPLPLYPSSSAAATALASAACDGDWRLTSSANSSSGRYAPSASSESLIAPSPSSLLSSPATKAAATARRYPSHSPPLAPSPAPPLLGSGVASVLSLRLNKREGRIEAVPTSAPARSGSTSSSTSPAVPAGAASAALSASWGSGADAAVAGATYRPGQPLPRPALKQVSRYSGGDGESASDAVLRDDGEPRSLRRANATTAAASSSAVPGIGTRVTSYLQDALIRRQQRRARDARAQPVGTAATDTLGSLAGGWATSTTAPPRLAGGGGRRGESVAKWSLLGVVALLSFFLVVMAAVMD
ncbi:hypothetical protein NESM_000537200 [Novymonas esmeraldas]|uniref:Uncharacterized protein n=1 Tax=Novymonas esmeraldas TaxID=1808958 RepID=A0AAW0EQP1_9TRYP